MKRHCHRASRVCWQLHCFAVRLQYAVGCLNPDATFDFSSVIGACHSMAPVFHIPLSNASHTYAPVINGSLGCRRIFHEALRSGVASALREQGSLKGGSVPAAARGFTISRRLIRRPPRESFNRSTAVPRRSPRHGARRCARPDDFYALYHCVQARVGSSLARERLAGGFRLSPILVPTESDTRCVLGSRM
jgi:hypothetical protein